MHYTAGGPRRHCRQLWGFLRGSTSVSLRRGGGGGGGGHDGRGGELPASLGPVGLDRVRGLVASTGPSLVGKATGDVRGQEVGVNFSEVRGAGAGGGGVGGVGVAAGGDSVGRVHGRRRRDLGR